LQADMLDPFCLGQDEAETTAERPPHRLAATRHMHARCIASRSNGRVNGCPLPHPRSCRWPG
jgi:hypothetical protein